MKKLSILIVVGIIIGFVFMAAYSLFRPPALPPSSFDEEEEAEFFQGLSAQEREIWAGKKKAEENESAGVEEGEGKLKLRVFVATSGNKEIPCPEERCVSVYPLPPIGNREKKAHVGNVLKGEASLTLPLGNWVAVMHHSAGPYVGETKFKLEKPGALVSEKLLIKESSWGEIRGMLITDKKTSVYPANVYVFEKGIWADDAKTGRDGAFRLRLVRGREYTLSAVSDLIKGGKAEKLLTGDAFDRKPWLWSVPGASLSAEITVLYRQGNNAVPYTKELAKKLDKGGLRRLEILQHLLAGNAPYKERRGFFFDAIESNKVCIYEMKAGDYTIDGIRVRVEPGEPGYPEKIYPVLEGSQNFNVKDDGPAQKLTVVVGEPVKSAISN